MVARVLPAPVVRRVHWRCDHRSPRTHNDEPRTANREPRTANREPRATNHEPRSQVP
ncbi:glycosyl transferase [Streptomyces sp. RLB3-17]|nr:glycosyl transferase [Streptomyces sp. RLB3-17]